MSIITQKPKHITKQFGTSYYLAMRFFPTDIREAVYYLYAFFRIPDEYVDNPAVSSAETLELLENWRDQWQAAYTNKTSDNPILRGVTQVFHTYRIPYQYGEDFLQAMEQDLIQSRYKTYQDLQEYMYGSASVVGCMLAYVIGFKDGALPYAEKLGEAMQLTNFIRDIKEDYQERDRIYLPEEDLTRFGVTEDQIKGQVYDQHLIDLIKFEVERARALYREAEPGINLLDPRGRRAVRLASRLYEGILDKIEQSRYQVFSARIRTNNWDKLKIVGRNFKNI